MRGKLAVLLPVSLIVALLVPGARAQEATPSPSPTPSTSPEPSLSPDPDPSPTSVPSKVTLRASERAITYGDTVRLMGRVDPIVPETVVRVVDRDGTEVATAEPEPDGTYSARISPRHDLVLTAHWLEASSDPLPVKVRPVVRVSLRKVRLFGTASIEGRVRPRTATRVKVVLLRNGESWRTRSLKASDGTFKTRIRITEPGRFRARASYEPEGLTVRRPATTSRRAAIPSNVSLGSRGGTVRRLEWRLRDLGYYIPKANRYYGADTRDAVIAFNKVRRRPRLGSVDASTWRALASSGRPKPLITSGSHIEIDQTRQVLFVVRKGKVRWILHTSTGAAGASRDGTWTVSRKLAGYSVGRLYYPSYYDGLRAVHGWPDVPTYPASHGCARVPMWAATWIHSKMPIGATVRVYH